MSLFIGVEKKLEALQIKPHKLLGGCPTDRIQSLLLKAHRVLWVNDRNNGYFAALADIILERQPLCRFVVYVKNIY